MNYSNAVCPYYIVINNAGHFNHYSVDGYTFKLVLKKFLELENIGTPTIFDCKEINLNKFLDRPVESLFLSAKSIINVNVVSHESGTSVKLNI